MDFEKTLRFISNDFQKEQIRYALIGGLAVGVWSPFRATADIDFLVEKKNLPQAKIVLARYGYSIFFESENVCQFQSDLKPLGSIDFILAFRPASLGMLGRAVTKTLFSDSLLLPVLRAEDLIGLKLQAFRNNPERRQGDLLDIENLLRSAQKGFDSELARGYFHSLGLLELKTELEKKIGRVI
ncbi:MAG: hypothetical protein JNM63_13465 [Spirochaetia bacterium]|nr:hypothetical protein [Spirochaetia bacterium]